MSRKVAAKEVIVKLLVGAGQASPSPPVGPALGSKGVKSMDFCKVKEFNALTATMIPGTPVPAVVTVRPDRSFYFSLRTPPTAHLIMSAAGVPPSKGNKIRGANAPGRTPMLPAGAPGALNPAALSSSRPGKSDAHSATDGSGIESGVVINVARSAGGDKEKGHGGGSTQVGEISLKHVYEIAKIKQREDRLQGLSLEGLVRSVISQARSCGVGVVP